MFDEDAVFALFKGLFNALGKDGKPFPIVMTWTAVKSGKGVWNGSEEMEVEFSASRLVVIWESEINPEHYVRSLVGEEGQAIVSHRPCVNYVGQARLK